MKIQEVITESLDNPYPIHWDDENEYGDVDALVTLADGTYLSIMFNIEHPYDSGGEEVHVQFFRNNSQEVTGEGDQQRVFATVLSAIQQYVAEYNPEHIRFNASKDVEPGQKAQSRTNLYNKLVQRYASSMGYQVDVSDFGGSTVYNFFRLNESVAENFADGRNPQDKGDSKRHGINTKASVSSLRKTAKNSSGRKQQLAHWLANMKAGRAKAKRK